MRAGREGIRRRGRFPYELSGGMPVRGQEGWDGDCEPQDRKEMAPMFERRPRQVNVPERRPVEFSPPSTLARNGSVIGPTARGQSSTNRMHVGRSVAGLGFLVPVDRPSTKPPSSVQDPALPPLLPSGQGDGMGSMGSGRHPASRLQGGREIRLPDLLKESIRSVRAVFRPGSANRWLSEMTITVPGVDRSAANRSPQRRRGCVPQRCRWSAWCSALVRAVGLA